MSNNPLNEDISSLIIDYNLFNSFIQSNQFEKTLELYSILTDISFNKQDKICLKILIQEIFQESSYFLFNEFKELFQIFQQYHILILIDLYDLINEQHLS